MQLQKNLSIDTILESSNLCELMDRDDIKAIGEKIRINYESDCQSRHEWEMRYAESEKLVMQLAEEKSFPWPGASNVRFPLLTIAALQYHARAYPALVRGSTPVSCRVIGDDPQGTKSARAKRVSEHMSFQIMEEDTQWEDSSDKALIVQSIMGCAFKKTFNSSSEHHVVSELVMPKDLVIPYYAKCLETAARLTHVIALQQDEVEERIRRGLFSRPAGTYGEAEYVGVEEENIPMPRSIPRVGIIQETENNIDGIQPGATDEDTPIVFLEHHFWLDLDGDGIREPYIGFVRYDDSVLYRLVARFEKDRIERSASGEILKIEPEHYFTKYEFIPSPDGSIYGMGFGMLLGATNEAINTIFNQLIDAGTMSNLGGGFLARGVRVRGGEYSFRPQEWKRTDSNANDLRNGIYPLPIREPSNVLLSLLNLLIDWGSRIGMATDAATGQNPGQNQKVGTTQAVIDQGEKVFNGIYKRTFRSMKKEFRLIYRLNYLNPPPTGKFDYSDESGQGGFALWQDYFESNKAIVPAADPSIASREKLTARDMMVRQMAGSMQGYDRMAVERRVLEDMEVPNIDEIFPPRGSQAAQPPIPPYQVQVAQIRAQTEQAKLQANDRRHQLELMEQARLNQAKVLNLEAQALKLRAEAGVEQNNQLIGLMDQELKAAKHFQDQLSTAIEGYGKIFESLSNAQGNQGGGGGSGQQQSNDAGAMAGMASAGGNGGIPGIPEGPDSGGQGSMG
jgi:chaperonin GroES